MKLTQFHLYFIGIVVLNIYAAGAHAQLEGKTDYTGKASTVIVEPGASLATVIGGNYDLRSYVDRRPSWGKSFSIGYSTYQPTNYQPDFIALNFADTYGGAEVPNLEFNFTLKKNSKVVSWGGEFIVGTYTNHADTDLIDSTLQAFPIRLGGILLLDALWPEPYFVPYVSAGAYTVIYKEDSNNVSVKGNTQIAPYVTAGAAFSLGWIDKRAARRAYEDSGIEATYAFVEARSFFPDSGDSATDFSSDINFAGGVRVEF